MTYVQTWHGSPIKVVGLDEQAPKYRGAAAHLKRFMRDVAKWDFLLSPSKAYTRIFRQAFGYDKEILEVGYPRNDVLVNDDGSRRVRVRHSLGIRPHEVAILYAPTWRDNAQDDNGHFFQPRLVDWAVLSGALPDDTVVLTRRHEHVRNEVSREKSERIRDVSDHEDVTDLLLAADALVTDYSSIIYDFALTGRPIILHAPDLERYRGDVRAFYFDYEDWAPGPITSTTEELAHQVLTLSDVGREHATDYKEFVATYCTFEDGRASERVVATLLERGVI